MIDIVFAEIYKNKEIRAFIEQQSRRYSKRRELQEEYEQEAWTAISHAPEGLGIEEYSVLAHSAIRSAYRQNYNEVMNIRAAHDNPEEVVLKEGFGWVEEEKRLIRENGGVVRYK